MTEQQFERGSYSPNPVNDTSIQSDNFGGLNTTATPFNLPYTDSPLLSNAVVDLSGAVFKRGGTRIVNRQSVTNGNLGSVVIPITTGLKFNFIIVKQDVNLYLYEINNDVATQVMTKANVWSSAAGSVRPGYCITSEVEPRVIMATGVNKPVQLKFVEQTSTQTLAAGSVTTLTVPNAPKYQNASILNTLVYVNRVRVSPSSLSWSGNTLTINGLSLTSDGSTPFSIQLVGVWWSWWAEATYWYGSSYYQQVYRTNVATGSGDTLAVPSGLLSFLSASDYPAPTGTVIPYKASVKNSTFTNGGRQPAASGTSYGFGDGTNYVVGANNYLNPSPNYISFGAVDGTSGYPVSFIRRRQHGFRFNTGQTGNNISVFVNGTQVLQDITQNGTGNDAYGNYTLYDNTYSFVNSGTSLSYYVSFENTVLGVGFNSKVLVVNTENIHIGSASNNTNTNYSDGSYFAVPGFGQFSDYGQGYYPRHVSLYQGRLVFCGFLNNPMLVLFSNQYDSVIPGTFYNFYQVDETRTALTDPFTITLTLEPNDRTIATLEWNGFVFILCRKTVYRGSGGQNYPLSFQARNISYIGNIGCVNEQSFCRTDSSILYLSDSGVYSLDVNGSEYVPNEQSIKIRDKFNVTLNPLYDGIPWMRYESINRRVYVGIANKNDTLLAREILVYTTQRMSWTVYTTPRGFNTSHGGEYVDRQQGTFFMTVCCTNRNGSGVPTDLVLLRYDYTRNLDWCIKTVASANATLTFPPPPQLNFTTVSGQQVFPIHFNDGGNWLTFQFLPAQDVDDLSVVLNGRLLTNQIDYVKQASGWLYLSLPPLVGSSLVVTPKGGYTFIFVDNTPYTSPYTVASNGTTTITNTANAVVEYGCLYLSVYTTPVFDQQTLAAFKRVKHIYVYMDNNAGLKPYQVSDVNSGDSQDPQQIVGNYTQRVDVNLTMLYSSDSNGQTTSDIYGYSSLIWDDAVFDIQPSSQQSQRYQLFKEPIQGVGYCYQFMLWSYDEATWRLAAYQIIATPKGQRYISPY